MGKQLRNRQILAETDFENDNSQPTHPVTAQLNTKALKKSISKKFQNRQKNHLQKHTKFFKTLENGTITQVLDQSKFECPICLELMVRPTLMSCGHMYCYRCLESNVAHSISCGLCRQQQNPEQFVSSVITENIINEILAPRSNEIFKYLCRTTDTSEWIKRRKLNNIRPGLIVDFQDAFKSWRRAIILKSFLGKNNKLMVNIKTFFKGTEISETIEASSKRLAPLNFFTRAKYLEEFTLTLPQYDIYEKALQTLEYRKCESSEDMFIFGNSQNEYCQQFQSLQVQQINQSKQDEALALFNWQMNGTELIF